LDVYFCSASYVSPATTLAPATNRTGGGDGGNAVHVNSRSEDVLDDDPIRAGDDEEEEADVKARSRSRQPRMMREGFFEGFKSVFGGNGIVVIPFVPLSSFKI
jgi:hypothetical protein